MDVPISQWFFRNEPTPFGSRSRGPTKGPRIAGSTAVPLGQVPTDTRGRAKDLVTLNKAIQRTYALARKMNNLPNIRKPPTVTAADLDVPFAEFHLAASTSKPLSSSLSECLLPMEHLGAIKKMSATHVKELVDIGQRNMEKTVTQCTVISRKQKEYKVQLTLGNLLTLFKDRWLDSVVLDAYLHVLQEHWPFKNVLYLNSAEKDPSLNQLKNTPTCYPYVLSVLFHESHWTVIMIDHVKEQIRYLNSQVVDPNLPDEQSAPFQAAFPKYHVQNVTKSQQCNQSDCGVYSAAWIMIYLYYNEKEYDKITCPDMYKFRETMLEQLILYYYLLRQDAISL